MFVFYFSKSYKYGYYIKIMIFELNLVQNLDQIINMGL